MDLKAEQERGSCRMENENAATAPIFAAASGMPTIGRPASAADSGWGRRNRPAEPNRAACQGPWEPVISKAYIDRVCREPRERFGSPGHDCGAHDKAHRHGPGCGHEAVPHGDHVDYLVDGHLHHPHGDHCDDHGKVQTS